MMCAAAAGKRNRSVLILDHGERTGSKIRVSGGGRCNFTNTSMHPDNYLSGNPHFCKSALARFGPHDFICMVERHGIPYYEKEPGQLFCRKGSGEIIEMLHRECSRAGAEILLRCRIEEIRKDGRFSLTTSQGTFESESLVIATGGLSYPKLGATDFGHRVARQFGIKVTGVSPALVPFTFGPEALKVFHELSGISLDAVVSCKGRHFRGPVLFTHRGLSGPAVLQISSYWEEGDALSINLLPDMDIFAWLMEKRKGKIEIQNLLSGCLPKRFIRKWSAAQIPQSAARPVNQCTEKELKQIADNIHAWIIGPQGTEGYKTAEVTRGGVDTDELSSKTMEAKKVPGLYFIGEVVDVTGQLGGYNLHWAWASGHAAGRYV